MLSFIKMLILHSIHAYCAFCVRLQGVHLGKDCVIQGVPHIRLKRGSKISLGNGSTLCSMRAINPMIERPCTLCTTNSKAKITIGDNCGISGSLIYCGSSIDIGDYTIIGAGTTIMDMTGHTYSAEVGWNASARRSTANPIRIGKKCFIGARCMIQAGVTIGDSCLIAAGTIVNRDIPDGHRVYGNPAICEPLPKALGGPGRSKKSTSSQAT